jgi:hypothetical protein
MGKVGKILAGGLAGGLVGASRAGLGLDDIAKYGGFGLAGMAAHKALRKKKKKKPGEPDGGMTAGAEPTMRRGGKVKKMAKGGKITRGDGCCKQGHTKGKMR